MAVELTKDSIDLGIVVADGERALAFYRDALGLEHEGDLELPNGSTMHRLRAGTSVVKLVVPPAPPPATAPPGGIAGATGYRYFTLSVADVEGAVRRCEEAGHRVAVPPRAGPRPGTTIAMVEDPDGNWVEFLATS